MMPADETRRLAEMMYKMAPEQRAKAVSQLGMVDGPPRPRRSRERPEERSGPVTYKVRRVPLS